MTDWHQQALALSRKGFTAREIAAELHLPLDTVRRRIKLERAKYGLSRQNHGQNTVEAGESVIIPPKQKTAINPIFENLTPSTIKEEWAGNQIIRFGLIGDTHINSKYTQLTYLHRFYDLCAEENIHTVYHTGDIDDGEQMRQGHPYECYTQGADEHVAEIVAVYPQREGIVTKFITGNHDASIFRRCGYDIGQAIAAKRQDMIYLGRDVADVRITPNCVLRLQHPWDGTAYALSYKIQKMIDAMEADTKPNILAVGHYHKLDYMFYRNIHAFQTGTMQGQTPFTRGKGISVHMGGWIVTVEVDKLGHIQRIIPELIPYYAAIPDDYKNFRGRGGSV